MGLCHCYLHWGETAHMGDEQFSGDIMGRLKRCSGEGELSRYGTSHVMGLQGAYLVFLCWLLSWNWGQWQVRRCSHWHSYPCFKLINEVHVWIWRLMDMGFRTKIPFSWMVYIFGLSLFIKTHPYNRKLIPEEVNHCFLKHKICWLKT